MYLRAETETRLPSDGALACAPLSLPSPEKNAAQGLTQQGEDAVMLTPDSYPPPPPRGF